MITETLPLVPLSGYPFYVSPTVPDDRLSFREFIYTFAQWLGLPEDDDDEILLLSQSGRLTEAVPV